MEQNHKGFNINTVFNGVLVLGPGIILGMLTHSKMTEDIPNLIRIFVSIAIGLIVTIVSAIVSLIWEVSIDIRKS